MTENDYLQCNPKNRELLEDFLTNSTELSDKTLKAYTSNCRIWLKWIHDNLNDKLITDIKPREYLKYQNWLLGLGHSSSDISNKRSAISTLNNYIVVYYYDDYPMFHNFINKSIKKPEKALVNEKIPPSREEVEIMCQKLEESKRKNKKELIAYLKFTFETGCRRAETRQLMKDIVDADLIEKTTKVKDEHGNMIDKTAKYYLTPTIRCKGRGKTGKQRRLKFSDYSMDAIKEWVSERNDDCPFLFTVSYGGEIKQVAEGTFNTWSTDIFTPLLGRRFHPHALREAIASDIVVTQGKSVEAAKALLGHESSATTLAHYVIGLEEGEEADELFT